MVVVDHPRPALTPGHAYVVVSPPPFPRHPEHTRTDLCNKKRQATGWSPQDEGPCLPSPPKSKERGCRAGQGRGRGMVRGGQKPRCGNKMTRTLSGCVALGAETGGGTAERDATQNLPGCFLQPFITHSHKRIMRSEMRGTSLHRIALHCTRTCIACCKSTHPRARACALRTATATAPVHNLSNQSPPGRDTCCIVLCCVVELEMSRGLHMSQVAVACLT